MHVLDHLNLESYCLELQSIFIECLFQTIHEQKKQSGGLYPVSTVRKQRFKTLFQYFTLHSHLMRNTINGDGF